MLATSNHLADTVRLPAKVRALHHRESMRTICAALMIVALLFAPACDDDTPTDPSEPALNLTGTWRGAITVNNTPAQMTWTLTQTNASVTGPALVALSSGTVLMNGALTGTLSGMTLTYTIAVPAGGIPLQPSCSGQIGGTSTVANASTMSGTYAVTSSTCSTGLTSGSFTLTK
jgi:hypothetical protein